LDFLFSKVDWESMAKEKVFARVSIVSGFT
jgi:hypothetical protein